MSASCVPSMRFRSRLPCASSQSAARASGASTGAAGRNDDGSIGHIIIDGIVRGMAPARPASPSRRA